MDLMVNRCNCPIPTHPSSLPLPLIAPRRQIKYFELISPDNIPVLDEMEGYVELFSCLDTKSGYTELSCRVA